MSFTVKRLLEYPPASNFSWGRLPTIYGVVWMVFCGDDLCFLGFASDMGVDLWPRIPSRIPRAGRSLTDVEVNERWMAIERTWLSGAALPFSLVFCSSDFEAAVWNALQEIRLGQTVAYSWVAEKLGNVRAVRSVASAIGKNMISILIPCHRVISKSGGLGGYAWGSSCKQALLSAEGAHIS